ncbi:hypothetical protein [Pedococcus sp. 5OH_020]|uniref:hypothetical protein n=1 Tax=Pedococcus sp. 5OH_020 TaxID=2989814 RepID=UPI0022E9A42F|nr:hypothetical protein [Pedococcus sp. 5OH_020]
MTTKTTKTSKATKTEAGLAAPTVPRARALRAWLVWTAGFLACPIAGVVGIAVAGRVDGPLAALLGGLVTGAVLGLGQALASSGRLPKVRWAVATSLGMGAGLLLGAHTVGYGTTMGELAIMAALTGAVLGSAQAFALPKHARARWVWALAMPALWPTGWAISTLVLGDSVDKQFTLFGSSGAITVTALLGILLHLLLAQPDTTARSSATTAATQATPNGDPS